MTENRVEIMKIENVSASHEGIRRNRVLDFPFSASHENEKGDERPSSNGLEAVSANLDSALGEWSASIVTAKMAGGFALVTVRISSGGFEREGLGFSEVGDGDGFISAEHMAFEEAASKFLRSRPNAKRPEIRAEAASISDLISYRQLRAVRTIARSKGVSADTESDRKYGITVTELSREAAEDLIHHLETLPESDRRAVKLAG